jgi:hypothetical protein
MKLIADIWNSLRALPVWVQIWMFAVLVPANFAGFLLWDTEIGRMTAIAAILGIGPNAVLIFRIRGFGKIMALPHLAPWTVLVIWLLFRLTGDTAPDGIVVGGTEAMFGWMIVVINSISLAFDYPDAVKWFKGDRAAAGRA